MGTDKNGKVSRTEFIAFMTAEFDRLDTNHDGELDVRELEKSQLMVVRHGGEHRWNLQLRWKKPTRASWKSWVIRTWQIQP